MKEHLLLNSSINAEAWPHVGYWSWSVSRSLGSLTMDKVVMRINYL